MGQINAIPKGFLDLFNAQQQGKTPPQYVDALAPVVDMTEFYLANYLGAHQVDANHAGASVFTVTVPDGEVWLLRNLGLLSNLTTTAMWEDWYFTAARFPRASSVSTAVPDPVAGLWATRLTRVAASNHRQSDGFTLPTPLLCQAGTILHARLVYRDALAARITGVTWGFNVLKG